MSLKKFLTQSVEIAFTFWGLDEWALPGLFRSHKHFAIDIGPFTLSFTLIP